MDRGALWYTKQEKCEKHKRRDGKKKEDWQRAGDVGHGGRSTRAVQVQAVP